MKDFIENVKMLLATYQDVFNISDPLPSKDTDNKRDVLRSSTTTQYQHTRKEPLSSSTTTYNLALRNQKCHRKSD